jgi:hypothetical protein
VVAVLVAAAAVLAVVTGHEAETSAATVTSPATFPAGQRLSGVVVSGATVGEAFGSWRHRPAQVVVSYSGSRTWAGVLGLRSQGLFNHAGPGVRRVYSVPLIPTDAGATLVAGSRGAYDKYWRTLAQELVAGGQAQATLRLGWEMNGTWFAWNGTGDPLAWVGAYRHAVTAMRSVPGERFSFDWSVALGANDPVPLYPGDGYVDLIGADLYDVSYTSKASAHAAVWRELVSKPYGLSWLAGFSAQHGKRISFAEWGLTERCDGAGGGDNPAFIDEMYAWMNAHDVAYEAYFNTTDRSICATFAIDSGTFPKAAARYKALFGGITS